MKLTQNIIDTTRSLSTTGCELYFIISPLHSLDSISISADIWYQHRHSIQFAN